MVVHVKLLIGVKSGEEKGWAEVLAYTSIHGSCGQGGSPLYKKRVKMRRGIPTKSALQVVGNANFVFVLLHCPSLNLHDIKYAPTPFNCIYCLYSSISNISYIYN